MTKVTDKQGTLFYTKKGVFVVDNDNKVFHTKVVIPSHVFANLPFYKGSKVGYYKAFVKLKPIKTRKKEIDEKYIKTLMRRV